MRQARPPAPIDPREFIRTHLPLVELSGLQGLRLHRANASSGLGRLAADDGFGSPYWAYAWPGGLAIAHYILDRPDLVAGRRVLDLGTGSGLVAIAAAKAGATTVIGADSDPYALIACDLNAEANGVSIATIPVDQLMMTLPDVDLVLAGDVFYAADVARHSLALLDRCLAAGLDVIVGDPGRAFLPVERLVKITDYEVREVGASADTSRSAVFTLPPSAGRALREDAL